MLGKMRILVTVFAVLGLIMAVNGSAQANWSETFGGNAFDLTTWLFRSYPELTGTFGATIQDGPDDNDYLSLDETSSDAVGGSQFGVGIGDPDDVFTDVRVGAVFNVNGDASLNYHGLAARVDYTIVPPGSVDPYPGIIASCYVLTIHYEEGPANLKIELVKAVNLDTAIMATWQPEVPVPGLDHARSHYFELDVVGSDPVYITGSVYEYKGGPLLVRTPTFIDTNANDPWEAPGIHDAVFTSGRSGIFGMWEDPQPAGYHSLFDSVSSVSDGPAAVNPSPADGATDLPVDVSFSWVEAAFATSRELWFGKEGAMQKIEPAPTGKTYDPGLLEFGQTYQWRVDEIGPAGIVTGHVWTFTTAECISVDDFESYATDVQIATAWPHNIPGGFQYIFLETNIVHQPSKAMRFEFQNQYDPYFTEATRTFNTPQNWATGVVKALSLFFRGEDENVEHLMYLKLEDASGHIWKVENPFRHACESESWQQWDIALAEFSDGGVNLASVKKITIGLGDGTNSGQVGQDRDMVYIDQLRLCPARCFNVNQLDLRGDVNGDCKIDLKDLAVMAEGWLNDGLSVVP